jgi:hypothetical protein
MPSFFVTARSHAPELRAQYSQPRVQPHTNHPTPPRKSISRGRNIPVFDLAHIKQMAPTTPLFEVRKELHDEFLRVGKRALKQQIKAEQRILTSLKKQKEKISFQIDERCVAPIVNHCLEGNGINKSLWSKSQDQLREIISTEALHKMEQQIDWLATRQMFFKEIEKSSDLLQAEALEVTHRFGSLMTK